MIDIDQLTPLGRATLRALKRCVTDQAKTSNPDLKRLRWREYRAEVRFLHHNAK